MKILVIQKKMMGDVLVSSIVFELLKKYYPNAELHYLIDKKHYQVIKNHRYIDKVIYFESFFSVLKRIRKGLFFRFYQGQRKEYLFIKNIQLYFTRKLLEGLERKNFHY